MAMTSLSRRPGDVLRRERRQVAQLERRVDGVAVEALTEAGDEPLDLRLRNLDLERHDEAGPLHAARKIDGLLDVGRRSELLRRHDDAGAGAGDERERPREALLHEIAGLGDREAADERAADLDTRRR